MNITFTNFIHILLHSLYSYNCLYESRDGIARISCILAIMLKCIDDNSPYICPWQSLILLIAAELLIPYYIYFSLHIYSVFSLVFFFTVIVKIIM